MTSIYRLLPDLQADLVWFWCEEESELGVRSNMGATIATLERRKAPARAKPQAPVPTLEQAIDAALAPKLSLADRRLTGHIDRKARRRAAIESLWYTMPVHDERAAGAATGPERSVDQIRRSSRIQGALVRLRRSPDGVRHQRVLFRVYGDPLLARRQDETAVLSGYAKTPAGRRELLSDASRAYAAAHQAEKQQRRQDKEARFMAILGAR